MTSTTGLGHLLAQRADAIADKIAFTFLADGDDNTCTVTYAELDRRARELATRLRSVSSPGDRAVIVCPPGLDFISAYFGCVYAGAVAVPAYPAFRARRAGKVARMARDCTARVFIALGEHVDRLRRVLGEADPTFEPGRVSWLAMDTPGELDDARIPPAEAGSDTIAHLQYTSGSTGDPRGVMVSHANVLANCRQLTEILRHDRDSVIVSWLPPFHDMGLVLGLLQVVYVGCAGVIMPPAAFMQKPVRWLRAISTYRGTSSAAPDFAYALCVRKVTDRDGPLDLSSWDTAVNGAEPVRARTLREFAEKFAPHGFSTETFVPGYGMAENTLVISGKPHGTSPRVLSLDQSALAAGQVTVCGDDASGAARVVSCGPSTPSEVAVVDPDTLAPCDADHVGEIWVSGPSVAGGYWGRDEETERTFGLALPGYAGTFLRTGDLGFVRDGEVFVTGRLKDLVVVRGVNHYPEDIEQTLADSDETFDAGRTAAFSVDDGDRERLVVVQEARSQLASRVDALARAAQEALFERYGIALDELVLVKRGSIPVTTSGKVRRGACRDAFRTGAIESIATWQRPEDTPPADGTPAPAGEALDAPALGRRIREIAARTLSCSPDELSTSEPLTGRGLDSLGAVDLAAGISGLIGRELPATLLYDYPTIDAIVAHVTGTETGRDARSAASRSERIAVVGIGCRLPRATTPDEFWRLLEDGVDAVTEGPPEGRRRQDPRHDEADPPPRFGAYLDDIDSFDAAAFRISPREATSMDPQQRLLLTVAKEALEDARIDPAHLAGSRTGVFVGIGSYDHGVRVLGGDAKPDIYAVTGSAFSIAANRISYAFDLRGPSMAIDTACSSSLVAIHEASESLRRGECDAAIVAGVNLVLSHRVTDALQDSGMLSRVGRCKTFDASADGYVRGEGCCAVVLRPDHDARARGENVRAVVLGSAVNQDGRSQGLTAPNGLAQESVIRAALERAGVSPREVAFVETHGTGTALGDPIEVGALARVFGQEREDDAPCLLGALKTNIGHLEAAAGITAFVKAVLAVQHGRVPPNLHYQRPNPEMPDLGSVFVIPTDSHAWPPSLARRVAGVSSFGFGGTNAHAVISEATDAIEHAAVVASDGDEAETAWESVIRASERAARDGVDEKTVEHFKAQMSALDALALQYMAIALQTLDVEVPPAADGEGYVQSEVPGVLPRYAPLVSDWVGHVARARATMTEGIGFDDGASPAEALRSSIGRLDAFFGEPSPIGKLVQRCGESLADVVTGRVDPLGLLFPAGLADDVEWVYRDSDAARYVNSVLAAAIRGVVRSHTTSAPLRVIEIGAGTGAATSALLEALPREGVSYSFTDVGDSFVQRGRTVLGDDPRVTFDLLDIERPAEKQGFDAESFDLVIASNVIHATADARAAIEYTRHLLKPGGIALLAELTRRRPWFDAVYGLVDDRRMSRKAMDGSTAPLLPVAFWRDALRNSGFADVHAISGPDALGQHVLVARADGGAPTSQPPSPSGAPALKELLYDVEWVETALPEGASTGSNISGSSWLLFVDKGGLGRRLASELRARGARAVVAAAAKEFSREGDEFWIRPCRIDDVRDLIKMSSPSDGSPWRAVIHMWGMDATAGDGMRPDGIADARALTCHSCIHVVRSVVTANVSLAPRSIWFVTRNAQNVAARYGPVDPFQAMSWGIGRVAAIEHPRAWGGLIDLAPDAQQAPRIIMDSVGTGPDAVSELAVRGGRRYTPKLVHCNADSAGQGGVGLRPDATYLVTGGLGGIGSAVARWLVDRGAHHLLLLGRTQIPAREAWSSMVIGSRERAMAEQIVALESMGAEVRYQSVDVGDSDAVARVIASLDDEMRPPLRGIVHAAGVIEEALIRQTEDEAIERVLRPKVQGALAVLMHVDASRLDFVVLCSSGSATIATPGTAAYAAANAFLDGLAAANATNAVKPTVVGWGAWHTVGMMDRERREARATARGAGVLTEEEGLAALEHAISAGRRHTLALRADWPATLANQPASARRGMLADMAAEIGNAVADGTQSSPGDTPEVAGEDSPQLEEIRARILQLLAEALMTDIKSIDSHQELDSLGLDSIMAIQLTVTIEVETGVAVPPDVFAHGTADDVARYIASHC